MRLMRSSFEFIGEAMYSAVARVACFGTTAVGPGGVGKGAKQKDDILRDL